MKYCLITLLLILGCSEKTDNQSLELYSADIFKNTIVSLGYKLTASDTGSLPGTYLERYGETEYNHYIDQHHQGITVHIKDNKVVAVSTVYRYLMDDLNKFASRTQMIAESLLKIKLPSKPFFTGKKEDPFINSQTPPKEDFKMEFRKGSYTIYISRDGKYISLIILSDSN